MAQMIALVAMLVLSPLVAAGTAPATTSTAWPAEMTPGLFKVGVADVEFWREGRELPMPVRVRYPRADAARPGPFPLVIFSHGMGGFTNSFGLLSAHLASHGYVVVHPAHTDSVTLLRREGADMRKLKRELQERGTGVVDLPSRVADCQWILGHIEELEAKIHRPGLIDSKRTAMVGNSGGAMTTQALAGLRFYPPGAIGGEKARGTTLADGQSFDAYVIISGQGTVRPTLNERSWEGFRKPTLVFTGSEDVIRISDETPASRRHPFEHAPAGDKYLVYIDGATHGSYQGKRAPRADSSRIEQLTAHATLAFLELYLKQDQAPRAWLNDTAEDKFAGVKAEYLAK